MHVTPSLGQAFRLAGIMRRRVRPEELYAVHERSASYFPCRCRLEAVLVTSDRTSRVLLIPAGVVLSTFFGGGYASGRETAEFISSSGPRGGVLAVATVGLIVGVAYFLCAEIARRYRTYDYASYGREVLGRWAVVYEIALLLGLVVVMAVAGTAAGSMIEDQFGIPRLVGTAILVLVAIGLTMSGKRIVQISMAWTAAIVIAALAGLVAVVAASGELPAGLGESTVTGGAFWRNTLLYASLGVAFLPLMIYSASGVRTRRESAAAAASVGITVVVPSLLLHVSFMSLYPQILDADVPTLLVADTFGSALFVGVFSVVLYVLIVQTGVGVIQGLVERVNSTLRDRAAGPMTVGQRGLFAVAVWVTVTVLASAGIVSLVAVGYTALALVYVVVFVIPLFTVGIARVRGVSGMPGDATGAGMDGGTISVVPSRTDAHHPDDSGSPS